ncbi:MAG: isoprenylcysteine carboxylmethyltransferase family protein [Chloroflexi bacterium]|nr:isoprenylcysteine carboxylmethyltransferase family protein [Chloroflexota bacterium]
MKYLRAVGSIIITLLVYLLLPLLGWGINDLPSFFSSYPRFGYAVLIILFALAVGYQAIDTPEGFRGSRGEESKRLHRQSIVAAMLIIILFGALFFLPLADRYGVGVMIGGQAVRWPGLSLAGFGLALIFWSGVALGKLYSAEVTIQKNHQLITTGLYRYIRHPRYLGVIFAALGLSLLFRSWIGLVVSIPLLGVLLSRIKDEEAVLYEEFGLEWETYRKQSWRLIPYLY